MAEEKNIQLNSVSPEQIKELLKQKLQQKKSSGGLVFEEIETGEKQDVFLGGINTENLK